MLGFCKERRLHLWPKVQILSPKGEGGAGDAKEWKQGERGKEEPREEQEQGGKRKKELQGA